MYLIEIFLPAHGPDAACVRLERLLTEEFGGVTSFSRSPAVGRFKSSSEVVKDDIIVIEVMAEVVDRYWWGELRTRLEAEFDQDEILIRASEVTKL